MSTADYRSINLRTARLTLRPMNANDAEAFKHFHQVNVDHFQRWMPTNHQRMGSDEAFEEFLERSETGYANGSGFRLIGVADDGRIAGVFALSEIVRRAFENAYGGWRVSCEFLRQGIGTEGVNGLLDLAFSPYPTGFGLHRVQANIQPTNLPSIALARKVGFREEGLAKSYLNIDGAWRDHLMFAKTAEEHPSAQRW